MFCKRVHATPRRNHDTVKELLTPPRPPQPRLSDQQHHRHHNPVPDKRTPHDEMRKALTGMLAPAEPQRHNPPKQHLCPRHHRHQLPNPTMHNHNNPPARPPTLPTKHASNPALLLLQMQLQPRPNTHLHHHHQHQRIRKLRVDVRLAELPALVHVAHEVRNGRDRGGEDLQRYVPAGVCDTQDHAERVEEAKGEDHEEDVQPEDRVDWVGGHGLAFGDAVVAAVGGGRGEEEACGEEEGGEGEERS